MVTNPDQQSNGPDAAAGSALLRKVRLGVETRQAQSVGLPKALRLTLAKVADDQLDMAMAIIGARMAEVDGETIASEVSDDALLMLMDGTGRRRAAVMLDAAFVGGLVQQQTMGKVLPLPEGEQRKLTATDAAISAPFVEALMARAAKLPDDEAERGYLEGYSFGARVESPRLLVMALDAPEYLVVHLTIDVAGGARQGTMTLILPTQQVATPGSSPSNEGRSEEVPAASAPASLERSVLALNAELKVALTSLEMPLGAAQKLAVGDVLDLGVSAFDQAMVLTRDGRKLSRGTLGQTDGIRALQLEHEEVSQRVPRRRASDRAELNLPQVAGDGTGTGARVEAADMPDTGDDLSNLSALDLPGELPPLDDLPSKDSLPELDGLPDLPDMSDLPGFGDDDELPRLDVG